MQSRDEQRAYDALVTSMSSVKSWRVRCGTCGESVPAARVDDHADEHAQQRQTD